MSCTVVLRDYLLTKKTVMKIVLYQVINRERQLLTLCSTQRCIKITKERRNLSETYLPE